MGGIRRAAAHKPDKRRPATGCALPCLVWLQGTVMTIVLLLPMPTLWLADAAVARHMDTSATAMTNMLNACCLPAAAMAVSDGVMRECCNVFLTTGAARGVAALVAPRHASHCSRLYEHTHYTSSCWR